MNHAFPTRSLVASIAVASLVALLIGCDEGPSQPPMTGTPPGASPQVDYVGVYGAEVGRTTVNVEVDTDEFTAVAFTLAGSRTAATYRPASVRLASQAIDPDLLVVLTGDIAQVGNVVTATITAVERNGVTLAGGELEAYTNCDITARSGTTFRADLFDDISGCLDLDTSAITMHQGRRPALWGTWRLESSSVQGDVPAGVGLYVVLSPSRVQEIYTRGGSCYLARAYSVQNVTSTSFKVVGPQSVTTVFYAFSSVGRLNATVLASQSHFGVLTFSSVATLPVSLDGCPDR